MAQTYAEQLDSVQGAIAKIEAGDQEATIGSRSYRRGDLKTLYERESWLRKMADRETRGGIRMQRGVPMDG